MTPDLLAQAVTFAVVLPGLLVAHDVADHWLQSHHQAMTKGQPGWPGRIACAAHVATYTLTTAGAVGLLWWLFALPITPLGFAAGQAVSAVTHYIADRRTPLEKLVNSRLLRLLGKDRFYRLGQPRRALVALTEDKELVRLFHPGKVDEGVQEPWDNPTLGTGAYALDQSWHR